MLIKILILKSLTIYIFIIKYIIFNCLLKLPRIWIIIIIYSLILIILLVIILMDNDVIIILISRFNKYLYKYIRFIRVILYSISSEISLSIISRSKVKLILKIIYFQFLKLYLNLISR